VNGTLDTYRQCLDDKEDAKGDRSFLIAALVLLGGYGGMVTIIAGILGWSFLRSRRNAGGKDEAV